LDEDSDSILASLVSWQPEDQASTVIRAVGIARTYVERGELNRAITTLSAVVDEDRHAAGAAVELGTLLLLRSRSGRSDHSVTDANRALNLAVQARDARRSWGGDSSDAVVLAVRAAALLGDIDRAWNLTQADGGEATAVEARAESVRRESAVLASLTGRYERAAELAAELDDLHVSSMNDAFAAMERGDEGAANAAWAQAFAHASTDSDRLTTAMYLAEAGAELPDLSDLRERHPEQVREIDVVHEVMSTKRDRIATLRARVHESARLAIALATHYTDQDQPEKAAQVLVDAGDRHREALLMRMGAERYMRARKYAEAQAAAEKALALGGSDWPGEYDARAVLHDAMMGQGDTAGAFAQAQALVALAPDDRTARWALVGALMRRNDGEAAWRALCPDGVPIDPRNPQEAWLWVDLAAEYDHGPRFVPRVLAMLSAWPDDEDLRGSVLARMFFALRERDDDDSDEGAALREAAVEYQQRWPDSPTFRAIQLGSDDDPLGPLTHELKEHANVVSPLLDQVKAGELPVGMVAAIGRTYTEAVVSRAAGMVRSFNPGHAAMGAAAIDLAREQGAVIDTSAMGTLVTLNDALRHHLMGSLSRVETSEGAYADALAAQASLGTRSTMTVGFDQAAKQPRVYEISEEEAELLATRAAAVADLAGGLTRRSQVGPSRFERSDRRTGWLEAYEIAREATRVFWCDDAVLANVARNEGIATFSTVDLLRAVLVDPSDKELLEVAEGTLVASYHVDLGFNADTMRFAAELDNWAARGAAFALSRPYTWQDAEAAGAFLLSALDRHGDATSGDLAALCEWTATGALGLLSAAPDDERASGNARILLNRILARPWLGADQLAAVVRGIRAAIEERPGAADPLVPVLREFYSRLVERTSHGLASKLFMYLVRQLPEADRQAAARIVLESD
jgi:tetratricopeptide (TPR) repeat protein